MANRYRNIEQYKTDEGTRYLRNVVYPEIPVSEDDLYVVTTASDRFDILAQQFYGDSSLWWIIASANVSKRDGLIVEPGVQLRIPASPTAAIQLFSTVNSGR